MHLDDLWLFHAVAETSGVSAAAKRLGVPKSSVSRGLARLERSLGVQLVHRTTRQLSLSGPGQELERRAGPLLAELVRSVSSLSERAQVPSGRLRVTTAPDFAAVVLAEIVTRFAERYPAVEVDLHLSSQFVDIVAERIDVALRISRSRLDDSALVARPLAAFKMHVYASPNYLERVAAPKHPNDLACVRWVGPRSPRKLEFSSGDSKLSVPLDPALACDDMFFTRAVLRAGAGVGLLPVFLAERELLRGELRRVLPRWEVASGRLWLVRPQAREIPASVQAFEQFVREALRSRRL